MGKGTKGQAVFWAELELEPRSAVLPAPSLDWLSLPVGGFVDTQPQESQEHLERQSHLCKVGNCLERDSCERRASLRIPVSTPYPL